MEHRIIPRAEWGARHDNGTHLRKVGSLDKWLHHSVTIAPDLVAPFDDDYAAVRRLEQIGEDRFGRGISYTFPITPAGLIFEGHSIDRVGSHTAGRNTGSVGICLIGDYSVQFPTAEQEHAIAWLLNHGVAAGWWKLNTLTGGHRDTKSTACPGNRAYSRIGAINALADGSITVPVSNPVAPAPAPAAPVAPPFPLPDGWYFGPKSGPRESVSGFYSHREDLRRWQKQMKHRGWLLDDDGLYGDQTGRVAELFQREKGLDPDRLIGPITWAAAWTAPIT